MELGNTASFSPMAARTEYEIGSKRGANLEFQHRWEKKKLTEEAEAVTPLGRKMLSAATGGQRIVLVTLGFS